MQVLLEFALCFELHPLEISYSHCRTHQHLLALVLTFMEAFWMKHLISVYLLIFKAFEVILLDD